MHDEEEEEEEEEKNSRAALPRVLVHQAWSVQMSIMQRDVVSGAGRVVDLRGGATGDLSDCAVLLPWW